jgi:GntR family transcriptional repressor for pyruvate dehydrogenase complex
MFEPIAQNLSLRDQIVQDILAKIEEGAISVGDRLPPERDLAISFNVSRTTVRDALRTLVGLGVLSIQHGKGIFVQGDEGMAIGNALWTPLIVKPDTIAALFEVRKTMETAAAGWAASRASLAHKEQLTRLVEDVKAHVTDTNRVDLVTAALSDQAFHTTLIIASHNPIAGRLMTNLLDLLEEVRKTSLAIPGRAWMSILDHERIAQAIMEGDVSAAQAAMMAHLTSVERAVLGSL